MWPKSRRGKHADPNEQLEWNGLSTTRTYLRSTISFFEVHIFIVPDAPDATERLVRVFLDRLRETNTGIDCRQLVRPLTKLVVVHNWQTTRTTVLKTRTLKSTIIHTVYIPSLEDIKNPLAIIDFRVNLNPCGSCR